MFYCKECFKGLVNLPHFILSWLEGSCYKFSANIGKWMHCGANVQFNTFLFCWSLRRGDSLLCQLINSRPDNCWLAWAVSFLCFQLIIRTHNILLQIYLCWQWKVHKPCIKNSLKIQMLFIKKIIEQFMYIFSLCYEADCIQVMPHTE